MRKKFLTIGWCSVAAILAISGLVGCQTKTPDLVAYTSTARQSDETPNIVLIVAHQLGFGDLGCYGQELVTTPNIDRLAAEGCRFTHAYAGGNSAEATMWTLMTGRYNAHAVQNNELAYKLSREQRTMPNVMRMTEYVTGFVGCWNLDSAEEATMPDSYGFDEWAGLLAPASIEASYPALIWRNGEQVALAAPDQDQPGTSLTDALTREAKAFIERHSSDKPFLLVFSYPLPGSALPLPQSGAFEGRDWTASQKAYAERISRLDGDVGKIIEQLDQFGLSRRTAVLLTSDSATRHEAPELDIFASHGELRTSGDDMYEGRLRVPLIVKWPAEVESGFETAFAVAPWDMMVTFADMAGAVLPSGATTGVSFLPTLLGQAGQRRAMMYWETRDTGFGQGVRIGDWKAVRPCGRMDIDAVELYNLVEDPGETKNQAKEHPEILARFIRG